MTRHVELDDRYPTRAAAVRQLRDAGRDDEAETLQVQRVADAWEWTVEQWIAHVESLCRPSKVRREVEVDVPPPRMPWSKK